MLAMLQAVPIYIVPFVLIISLIITIHELGHYFAARACGVAIDRFSLGFGRAIVSRRDKRGVEWRIGWIPLGGYVRFAGDSNDASLPDGEELEDLRKQIIEKKGPDAVKHFYHFKPVWQRAIIAAAGPAANFILAITIFTVILSVFGQFELAPRVGQISQGTPAAAAGFMTGDLIRKADGRPIRTWAEVVSKIRLNSDTAIDFQVERGGKTLDIIATPRRTVIKDDITNTEAKMGQLGFRPAAGPGDVVHTRYNPATAFVASVRQVGDVIGTTVTYIGKIFTGRESGDQLGGVVGMAQAAGSLAKAAATDAGGIAQTIGAVAVQMIWFAGFISIGIGFVNLLPIPMLDGGHLMFYAYEAVARRPVGTKIQAASYRVGLALVLGLMLFATWNDLQRLRAFQFLGGLFS
ncbi:site-2 protease family protein [soil metagenome]